MFVWLLRKVHYSFLRFFSMISYSKIAPTCKIALHLKL